MHIKGKVLLIHPWIVDFAAYDFWIKPVGLLTIGAALKEQSYNVSLLDCLDRHHPSLPQYKDKSFGTGHYFKTEISKPRQLSHIPRKYSRYGLPVQIVQQQLQKHSPDLILITSGMTYWYPGVFQMIEVVRTIHPDIPIVLGGIYATLCQNHAETQSGADAVIPGQGIVESLNRADMVTGNQSNIEKYADFNASPWPLYDLYPKLDSAAILTSYGCPYRCPFCASHLLSPGFIRKDPIESAREIVRLYRLKSVEDFAFYDDALLYKKEEHILSFLEYMKEKQLPVRFHTPNGLQPKAIDMNLAQLMYQTGFQTLKLSFESTSPERQKSMGFKVNNEDLTNAVKNLFKAGFKPQQIGCYVLMGLPGQPIEEVIESVLFVYHLGVKVNLASFTPVPGTPGYEDYIKSEQNDMTFDPILTNNSIFPLKNNDQNYESYLHLREWVGIGNQLISAGKNPLKEKNFKEKQINI